jgi:hypothetical protein
VNLLTRLRVTHRFQNHLGSHTRAQDKFSDFLLFWGFFGRGGKDVRLLELLLTFTKETFIPMLRPRYYSVRITTEIRTQVFSTTKNIFQKLTDEKKIEFLKKKTIFSFLAFYEGRSRSMRSLQRETTALAI